jgi:hypothetical protein
VWPDSFAKSTLQESISGAAKVAPLPLMVPAKAGEAIKSNADVAIEIFANLFFKNILPPVGCENYVRGIQALSSQLEAHN